MSFTGGNFAEINKYAEIINKYNSEYYKIMFYKRKLC